MLETLRQDAAPILRSWTASRKPVWLLWMRLMFMTPGFQLVLALRFQRSVGRVPIIGAGLRRVICHWTTLRFGCDVDPEAIIAPGFYVPHPIGIVIGGGIRIGRDVTILQNVTLGRSNRDIHDAPVIGDRVEIGCGACVIGGISVGEGAIVGANSVVNKDVPAGAIAVGSPARIIWRTMSEEAGG